VSVKYDTNENKEILQRIQPKNEAMTPNQVVKTKKLILGEIEVTQ
jgi:hypothetical protein